MGLYLVFLSINEDVVVYTTSIVVISNSCCLEMKRHHLKNLLQMF